MISAFTRQEKTEIVSLVLAHVATQRNVVEIWEGFKSVNGVYLNATRVATELAELTKRQKLLDKVQVWVYQDEINTPATIAHAHNGHEPDSIMEFINSKHGGKL